jgi:DNA primase
VPDTRDSIRSLPFPVVASALGWDVSKFKRHGKDWVGRCYLHGSKTNEACFRYHAETGAYHCFSCHTKGKGCIDITIAFRKCNFSTAVAFLEPLVGKVPLERKEAPRVISDAVEGAVLKPYSGKYQNYQVDCEWLRKRIPDQAVRERFGIFCYSNPSKRSKYDGRVLIPFHDIDGVHYGYMGRAIEGEPKYLVPPGFPKSRFVFGAHLLKPAAPYKMIYLVESCWSVMKFYMLGLPALSTYGWSVSPEQLDTLAALTGAVCYLPDRNKAGQESAGVVQSMARRLYVHAPELPDGTTDPETLGKLEILAL